ncbi:TadE/TadG family type IV pilus assembly protein [Actinobaculum sp. 313]|uniref:TadE/TadG family type IV pilus assembly protein n=1 Tax=Actinobaculum sp. 313 TaxID=2495645 RepID=UPI000F741698|nr:TadE/TadG family type IV pilus assembly protein [Actinobaculum sp. 313]
MRSRASSEKGSAVVGFTMAVALLLFAVLALFSLAITLHVRTVLQDAAAEGHAPARRVKQVLRKA